MFVKTKNNLVVNLKNVECINFMDEFTIRFNFAGENYTTWTFSDRFNRDSVFENLLKFTNCKDLSDD